FFFKAEDGIRYWSVTGVQTCALPILKKPKYVQAWVGRRDHRPTPARTLAFSLLGFLRAEFIERPRIVRRGGLGLAKLQHGSIREIGRASCRGRGWIAGGGGAVEEEKG